MKTLRRPSAAAFHEAGHAVAAQSVGWRVLTVDAFDGPRLRHGAWVAGEVSILPPTSMRRVPRALRAAIEAEWRRQALIIVAAGHIAQRVAYPRSRDGAGNDRVQSLRLRALGCSDARSDIALDRYVRAEAEALVERHWQRIEAVAARLSAEGTLNRREFRLAFVAADQKVARRPAEHSQQPRKARRHDLAEAALVVAIERLEHGDAALKAAIDRALDAVATRRGISCNEAHDRLARTVQRDGRAYRWRLVPLEEVTT